MPRGNAAEIDIDFVSNKEGKIHITSPSKPKSLLGWHDSEFIKASLGDITTNEYANKEANAIIIVQSGVKVYKLDNNKELDKELIKNAVSEEFSHALMLLKQTKLPVCFVRGIPRYDEGYKEKITKHYIFLYFFHNHNHKNSVLIIDPQGSKFGTDQNEKAIDEEFVDIILHAAKENEVQIYVSQDVIQQDGLSCGSVSVELARAFYEASSNEKKKEKLFEILKDSQLKSAKLNDNSTLEYQLCKLGNSIISQKIIDDFNNKVKHEFIDGNGKSHDEEVGGQKIREAHYHTSTLINEEGIKSIKSGSTSYTIYAKRFLKSLGASDDLLKDMSLSFSSGIITKVPILDIMKVLQVKRKRIDLGIEEEKKTNSQHQSSSSNSNGSDSQSCPEEKERVNQNLSDQQKSSKSESHNNAQDHKPAEKSEFSKILATIVVSIAVAVALLGIAILTDIKKEFKIGVIVLSSVMLIFAVTCCCLSGKIKDPKIETTPILQQSKT